MQNNWFKITEKRPELGQKVKILTEDTILTGYEYKGGCEFHNGRQRYICNTALWLPAKTNNRDDRLPECSC